LEGARREAIVDPPRPAPTVGGQFDDLGARCRQRVDPIGEDDARATLGDEAPRGRGAAGERGRVVGDEHRVPAPIHLVEALTEAFTDRLTAADAHGVRQPLRPAPPLDVIGEHGDPDGEIGRAVMDSELAHQ
jgi:hypothetical protein